MRSEFGQQIFKVAQIKDFKTYLEIGTWNGQGSTVCLMNGLIKRQDDSKLYSIELMPEMFQQAKQFWSWLESSAYAHQLVLLNGKIIDNGLMTQQQVEAHPAFEKVKTHYQLYYQSDQEQFNAANNISEQLPNSIDVAVLDGGEFCSFAEFEYILSQHSPKVFILDDTSIIKCSQVRQVLIDSTDWQLIYDKPEQRHGASIFVRNEYTELFKHTDSL